jgi:hypothetical protein
MSRTLPVRATVKTRRVADLSFAMRPETTDMFRHLSRLSCLTLLLVTALGSGTAGASPKTSQTELQPSREWFDKLPKASNDQRAIIDWAKCWKPNGSLPQGGFKVGCRPVLEGQPADFALMTGKNEINKDRKINDYRVQITREVQTLRELKNKGIRVVGFVPRVEAVACYNYPNETCTGFLIRWISEKDGIMVQVFDTADPQVKASYAQLLKDYPEKQPLPELDARLDRIATNKCEAAKNAKEDFEKIADFEKKHYFIADLQGFLRPDGHFLVMDPGKGGNKGPGPRTETALATLEAYIKACNH